MLVPSEGRLRASRSAAHGLTANHRRWALLAGHRRWVLFAGARRARRPRHVGRTRLPWPRRQCVDHRAVRHRRTRRRPPRRPGPHRRQHRNHRRALDGGFVAVSCAADHEWAGRVVLIEGGLHLGVETRWHPRSMTCSTQCAVPRSNDRGPRSPTTPPTTSSAGGTRRSTTPTSGHQKSRPTSTTTKWVIHRSGVSPDAVRRHSQDTLGDSAHHALEGVDRPLELLRAPSGIISEPPGPYPDNVVAAAPSIGAHRPRRGRRRDQPLLDWAWRPRSGGGRHALLLTGAAPAPRRLDRGARDGATLPTQMLGARQGCYDGCRRTRRLSRSRRLTIPTNAVPATTGRWRNPLPSMISAARSESTWGPTVSGSCVIHLDTGERVRSLPDAAARRTSRSVKMPTSIWPCMTTAEPKRPFAMAAAASATGLSGTTVNTSAVMTSASSTINARREAQPVSVPLTLSHPRHPPRPAPVRPRPRMVRPGPR